MKFLVLSFFVVVLYFRNALSANFRVSLLYTSGMVLQMAPKSAHVWGFGEPGSEVTLSFDSHSIKTVVHENETWSVRLPPMPQGGPHEITVDHVVPTKDGARAAVVLSDVMFGDVWLCAGEENMELFMNSIYNATEEIALAQTYSQIRIMHVGHQISNVPVEEPLLMEYTWTPISEQSISWFSAVCLLFAERLANTLGDRPLGVVEVAWTFTPLQAWVSPRVTEACNVSDSSQGNDNSKHNVYYNSGIYPLTKLAIRGAIWNQGETNEELPMSEFACATSLMARDWRESFVDGHVAVPAENGVAFPFGLVQIGPDAFEGNMNATNVRLYQSAILDPANFPEYSIPEVFSAATYDLADFEANLGSRMFRDKQTVATRLAEAAKQLLYSEARPAAGPKFDIKMVTYDSDTSVAVMAYDTDVIFQGTAGFGYGSTLGNWTDTQILSTSGRTFSLEVDPSAKFLVYAHRSLPCDYRACAVYSDDPSSLPAQVVLIPWTTSRARDLRVPTTLLATTLLALLLLRY